MTARDMSIQMATENRLWRVLAMFDAGMMQKDIGRKLGVSSSRAHQLVIRAERMRGYYTVIPQLV